MVAGHAVTTKESLNGVESRDDVWYLLPYQLQQVKDSVLCVLCVCFLLCLNVCVVFCVLCIVCLPCFLLCVCVYCCAVVAECVCVAHQGRCHGSSTGPQCTPHLLRYLLTTHTDRERQTYWYHIYI